MATKKQVKEQPRSDLENPQSKNSSATNDSQIGEDEAEDMTRTALAAYRAREEEFERRKKEVTDRLQAHLGRVGEEHRRLAELHKAVEGFVDPIGKEAAKLRKKIDAVNKDLKSLGQTCQRKEHEYQQVLDLYNVKSKEKAQLITVLMEVVTESERQRMKKLDELSKDVDSMSSTRPIKHP
ncbi:unnamed protein product [Cuscuta epithymum]|uniref:RAB6-interacting golgin n=2 Tax=Cuscuta epithymum TaxID=186058 RepID=A0AAV0FR59_9ASTE|nr:unnamed protein product [Cuscuta epithymum]